MVSSYKRINYTGIIKNMLDIGVRIEVVFLKTLILSPQRCGVPEQIAGNLRIAGR